MLIAVSFPSQYNKSTLDCFFTAWFLPVNALNIGFYAVIYDIKWAFALTFLFLKLGAFHFTFR